MAIPQILHQSWKTTEVKPEWIPYQKTGKKLHPEWEYRFWTDEDNEKLVREHAPDFLDRYLGYSQNIMRADSVRYLYMKVHGGLYFDLDYEFVKPYDLLEYDLVLPESRQESHKDGWRLGNCILASAPGHPFWDHVLAILKDQEEWSDDVEDITGPKFLTRAYESWIKLRADKAAMIPTRMQFHPPSPKSQPEYDQILQEGQAYGIHHCTGVWRVSKWRRLWTKMFG